MKKCIWFAVFAAAVVLSSCSTVKNVVAFSDEMKAENIVMNTCFDKNDYVILGSISGSSDYVYYDDDSEMYVGDTYKYGYLNFPERVAVGKGFAAGYGIRSVGKGESPYAIARANAYYELIKKARELGADSVLEPTIQAEYDASRCKVTVHAIAVQLKKSR